MSGSDIWEGAEVIYAYTRAHAIEDGVLVDVSEQAREAGITFPVALTSGLWFEYIDPENMEEMPGQDVIGRLWDVLIMFFFKVRALKASNQAHTDIIFYDVIFQNAPEKHKKTTLKAVCGPGDHGEPVITIMLPNED